MLNVYSLLTCQQNKPDAETRLCVKIYMSRPMSRYVIYILWIISRYENVLSPIATDKVSHIVIWNICHESYHDMKCITYILSRYVIFTADYIAIHNIYRDSYHIYKCVLVYHNIKLHLAVHIHIKPHTILKKYVLN